MLTIRLARQGRKNTPHFRLVVQEKTVSPKSGKYVASIGHYDPTEAANKLTFEQDQLTTYLKNGATPSDTVARLLIKAGVKGLEKFVAKYTKQKARKDQPKAEEKPAEEKKESKPAEEKQEEPAEKEAKKEEVKEEKPAEEKKESKPAEESAKTAVESEDKQAEQK